MTFRLLAGAVSGILSWVAYAAVEFAVCTVFPLATRPNTVLALWHWQLAGAVSLCYVAVGALLGAALGSVCRPPATGLLGPAMITVPVLLVVHLCVERPDGFRYGAPFAALVAGLAIVAWLRPGFRFAGLILCPWTLSTAVLLPFWARGVVLLWDAGWTEKAVAAAGMAVLAGMVLALVNWRRKPDAGFGLLAARYTAAAALIAVAAFGFDRSLPAAGPASGGSRGSQPNVVLIVLDTVRASNLSIYGYGRRTSPELEKLAGGAEVFTRAIATSDMTLPTHASMFTGVYSGWHGAHLDDKNPNGTPIAKEYPVMAELLAARGYYTAGITANTSFVLRTFGMDRGFSVFDSRAPIGFLADGGRNKDQFLRWTARKLIDRVTSHLPWDAVTRRAAEISGDAREVLRRAKGAPFFLFLNFMDAHVPYLPPAPFDTQFPGKTHPFARTDFARIRADLDGGVRTLTGSERQHFLSQYDGAIAYLDSEIGALIEHLKREGLYDNTLLIVTADHGEALGERNLIEHAVGSIYQMHIHIPLLVKYPGQKSGRVVDAPVSQIDLLPTVLDAVGLKAGKGVQGMRLADVAAAGPRDLFSECFRGGSLHFKRAIIRWPLKRIIPREGPRELFDLSADGAETHDLSPSMPAQAEELDAALTAWRRSAPPRRAGPAGTMDEETMRRLKSLGYVQ